MERAGAERRLAAIMFTDIVGYTALMARDEETDRRALGSAQKLFPRWIDSYAFQAGSERTYSGEVLGHR